MKGNILLAVLTIMIAMLLLAPALLAGGHAADRRKKRARTAVFAGAPLTTSHTHHRWHRNLRHWTFTHVPRDTGAGLHKT
jgi:hypothetical protein